MYSIAVENAAATRIAYSANGAYLLLKRETYDGSHTEIIDALSGKRLYNLLTGTVL